MEREHLYLPGDRDEVSHPIELPHGRAALLFIQGARRRQNDAIWAALIGDQLVVCAADGAGEEDSKRPLDDGGEMAKWVVEFAKRSAESQDPDRVDPYMMQCDIRDSINQRNSLHKGYASSLCLVIDGRVVRANSVGDSDTRKGVEIYPHPDLLPYNDYYSEFRTWWKREGRNADPLEVKRRFDEVREKALLHKFGEQERRLRNCHGGVGTDMGEAEVTQRVVELELSPGERLVAGTDGLENVRWDAWHRHNLPRAFAPQNYLTDLWTQLENHNGENASGVAFFCDR